MAAKVALLVFACDRYELLYEAFTIQFQKHWPHSTSFNYYFSTEEKAFHSALFKNLKSGTGPWSNRLKNVLQQIEEDYVLFFQEDMWLYDDVNKEQLEGIIDYSISHHLNLVKLHSSEVYIPQEEVAHIEGLKLVKLNKEESRFLMSHQVSLWKKSFLFDQLKDNEHPWRNERRGSKRLSKDKSEIYQVDLMAENEKPPINKNDTNNDRGGYHTVSVNATLHPKAQPLISEIKKVNPTYAERLQQHLNQQITHDGLAQPRKIDIFKKLKNRFQGK